ncbi:heat-inducible transcriptional repressor HrcA [Mycoplasma phocimorsus]|uniref:heat-inducible transcriptional repressor HrcA n=1 Tax=Mycoplasma phocimorsus TaxID=3045839 RepID=UPI0024C04315|nr:heat-inducible transcriptional repressor HrcA [Mycoplasma phocimorsus]MDJ1646572.1 heat-inducible transcriptional repressor HrcA [Mycoplasma phocimorsus]MDJ1647640.1 heat-inducible transcriptional repressor HrcA [Mycoplasma phocimorsus]MDJ1648510.1 heat-inducible transcriptional repressor HrcA [Mycoplasma phocimorsus]MDJ1649023.1 heat-inducible transcriptional repressor HrcA [Mycoplasma phocimorsus]
MEKIKLDDLNLKERVYFKAIIENYIQTGKPVGSKHLMQQTELNVSSATIRNFMATLEQKGFLEKEHISSGRIPTAKGFNYYGCFLSVDLDTKIKSMIEDLFAKRRVSIDETIDLALQTIAQSYDLTLVASSDNSNELLMSIQLVPISQTQGTVIIVSSSGNVWSKIITFEKGNIDDVRIAIRLFKERLINTPLIELRSKTMQLSIILERTVKNYEDILKSFVDKVFTFEQKNSNKVYNKSSMILSKDISRPNLSKLIYIVENESIWKMIEDHTQDEDNIKLLVSGDSSLISKRISSPEKIKEISIVGPKRLDYNKAKTVLKTISALLEQKQIQLKKESNNE